jgi:hypothetical protein
VMLPDDAADVSDQHARENRIVRGKRVADNHDRFAGPAARCDV